MGLFGAWSLSKNHFNGRVVVVVGASSGIGAALAEEYFKKGAKVVITARRVEKLEELAQKLKSIEGVPASSDVATMAMDVVEVDKAEDYIREATEKFGRIDDLVLNAGIGTRGLVREQDISVMRRVYEVNVFSYFALTKAVLPQFMEMKTRNRVVVVGSVVSLIAPSGSAIYASSKHAVLGFFTALAGEVKHKKIEVNIVCPGYVNTEISEQALTSSADQSFGKKSKDIANGYTPEYLARNAVRRIEGNHNIIVVAQPIAHFGIWAWQHAPGLFRSIMNSRGKKLDQGFEKRQASQK